MFLRISTASAQAEVDPMKVAPHELMKKLAWIEGTWEGEGEVPGAGKYTSVVTYTIDLNGHIIRYDYRASEKGNVVWREQGLMAYNDDVKKVVGTTIGIDGSFSDGEGMLDSTERSYILVGHTAGATPFKNWRSTMTRIDDATVSIRFEVMKGDTYEFVSEETMRKKK